MNQSKSTTKKAKDKTYGAAGFIALRAEEFKAQKDEEVRSQDEANNGADNSKEEHCKHTK